MTHPPATPPGRRRRRNPQGTRERLVRSALDLFTAQGYHETTTPQIARRAGVAEGTIYRHFQSKEHLLTELYRGGVRVLLRAVAETPTTASCPERLHAVATAWRELAVRDPALVRMVTGRRFTALLDDRSRQTFAELRGALVAVVASGKSAGVVRPGNAETWTDVWYRLVTLVLERLAAGEWKNQDAGPGLVMQAAWDAITAHAGQGAASA